MKTSILSPITAALLPFPTAQVLKELDEDLYQYLMKYLDDPSSFAVIGIAAYKKIGPGKKKKADFDEVEDDEEEVVNDYVVDDDVVTNEYEDEAEETEEFEDSDDM